MFSENAKERNPTCSICFWYFGLDNLAPPLEVLRSLRHPPGHGSLLLLRRLDQHLFEGVSSISWKQREAFRPPQVYSKNDKECTCLHPKSMSNSHSGFGPFFYILLGVKVLGAEERIVVGIYSIGFEEAQACLCSIYRLESDSGSLSYIRASVSIGTILWALLYMGSMSSGQPIILTVAHISRQAVALQGAQVQTAILKTSHSF